MNENNAIETVEYNGYTIEIHQDQDYGDNGPREWDNLGTMACWHNRYNLGDVQPKDKPAYYISRLLWDKGKLSDEQFDSYYNEIDNGLLKKFSKWFIWLPIFAYEHGGITISTGRGYPYNDLFDSGQLGIIYIDKEDVRKEYNCKHITSKTTVKVIKRLMSEVEVYDDYFTGNVYGFIIKDQDDNELESCWGFYGDYDKNALEEAKSIIDWTIENHNKQAQAEQVILMSESSLFVGL